MITSAKAIVYNSHGGPEVLRAVDRPVPSPEAGEVLVRIVTSGLNPTDWKTRQGSNIVAGSAGEETVPHHDGSGTVEAVGANVEGLAVGDRVWTTLAGHGSPGSGTAQEFASISTDRVFHLPDEASFDQGASVGIPAITAHRALTVSENGVRRLAPGALTGQIILIPGGAGAVGHAAIQLAHWAGATVISTVSSTEKAKLATAAGADHTLIYSRSDLIEAIRRIAPDGVDTIVEVAASANASLDTAVLADRGTIAIYGNDRGSALTVNFGENLVLNLRYQFVLLYTLGGAALTAAAEDINAALTAGALPIGEDAGLPIHHFALDQTAAAHAALEGGLTGKALVAIR